MCVFRMDNDFLVKIADFGMARDVHSNEYYRLSHKAKLPIKWMAPECFYDGKFDHKSDVVCTYVHPLHLYVRIYAYRHLV